MQMSGNQAIGSGNDSSFVIFYSLVMGDKEVTLVLQFRLSKKNPINQQLGLYHLA